MRGVAVVGCAVAVLLAGCSARPPVADQPPGGPPPQGPQTGRAPGVVVAIDGLGPGFNPHVLAHQSEATTAIAELTLPSAFRRVANSDGTRLVLDTTWLRSAEVTRQAPFTVTYRIDTSAQWSNQTPITADDFTYLWQQMSVGRGLAGAEGYQRITAINAYEGGKVAEVVFDGPYPRWRELFTYLLPGEAMRAGTSGFYGLSGVMPASGGPYVVSNIDGARVEVQLLRNDRYWRKQPLAAAITLRRVGSPAQLTDTLRKGETQIAAVTAGPALAAQLAALPRTTVGRGDSARVLGLTVNARTVTDVRVRRALLGALTVQTLRFAGAGDAAVDPVESLVRVPTDAGYKRATTSPVDPERLLSEAGYTRVEAAPTTPTPGESSPSVGPSTSVPATPGERNPGSSSPAPSTTRTAQPPSTPVGPIYQKDGTPLTIRVGAIAGDPVTTAVANAVVDQLVARGVTASLVSEGPEELYLGGTGVDIVVGWDSAAVSAARRLAAATACTPAGRPLGSNVAGLCDAALSAAAAGAVDSEDSDAVLDTAEPLRAAQSVYLPVYQEAVVTAYGPTVVGVTPGIVPAGVFASATTWEKIG